MIDSIKDHVHSLVYIGKGEEELLQKARDAGLKVRVPCLWGCLVRCCAHCCRCCHGALRWLLRPARHLVAAWGQGVLHALLAAATLRMRPRLPTLLPPGAVLWGAD